VNKDYAQAAFWYQKAAEQGNIYSGNAGRWDTMAFLMEAMAMMLELAPMAGSTEVKPRLVNWK
jgi:TPR repeat protein